MTALSLGWEVPGQVERGFSRFSGSRATVRRMHDHDRGLSHDLPLITRRRALATVTGGLGLLIVGCGSSDSGGSATATPAAAGAVPEETAGPFPGDGSNGPNVLSESGVVRRDITKSFGDASGVAEGVPTTLALTLVDVAGGGGPLAGAAVYVWHCDKAGRYSLYDGDVASRELPARRAGERRRREALVPRRSSRRRTRAAGHTSTSRSTRASTLRRPASTKLRTSQIALPKDVCDRVFTAPGYEQSVQNLASTSLESDMVFSDGYAGQLAKASGDAEQGITLSLNVGV